MTTRNVEDVYGLSPSQEGMLFHARYEPDGGIYVSQIACVLDGIVPQLFADAWQYAVDRHPALRSAFVWQGVERPLQVVARRVTLAWEHQDWRLREPSEQRALVEEYLAEDRRRGFKLSKPPLMRLSLLRLADERHQFVWTHHHLLVDGWSVSLVVREVFTAYAALVAGREPTGARPRPYRQFVEWLGRRRPQAAEAYWRRTLEGAEVPTPLPDNGAAGAGGKGLAQLRIELSATATASLQELARAERLTVNTLVQGAWALCLARSSGRRDVVFGAVSSGRPPDLPGADGIVGVFINTLPVRIVVEPDEPVADWLRRLQAAQAEAREFESCALSEIHGWSGIDRRAPLFESILVFENYPVESSMPGGSPRLGTSGLRITESSNYPLALVVVPGARLAFKAIHQRARLSSAAARRLLDMLSTALEELVAAPHRPVGAVTVTPAAARHQMLREWNDTARSWHGSPLLHEMILVHAVRRPDQVAAFYGDRSLTFGELGRGSARLAGRLRTMGVGPDVVVAVVAERSLDALVGILAILRAGGAYLPLDPDSPPHRWRWAIEQSKARVVLADASLLGALTPGDAPVLPLEGAAADGAAAEPAAAAAPAVGSLPDDLAYVLYTSGSTGEPKGVMVSHRGVANYLRWAVEAYAVAAGEGALVHSSLAFDLTVTSLFAPLAAGRPVFLLPHEGALEALAAALATERRGSLVKLTPAHLQALADLSGEGLSVAARTLVLGGEALRGEDLAAWRRSAPGLRLFNEYGPTETVVGCALHEVAPGVPAPGPVAIGRPIANSSLYVLDRDRRPVARGAAGELFVGGAGVARGYLRRPGLTAERFVPDPFSAGGGARLYRTGDLVRHRPDGELEFLGRIDRQVKLRGTRIEPGEIESTLGAHPAVRRCLVVPRGAGDRRRLVAYVVRQPGTNALAVDLAAFLAERLPAVMVPAAFVLLDRLPMTPNGKVDRAALPADEGPVAPTADGGVLTTLEEALCGIWSELTGTVVSSREADFFDLGGHSLLATRLVSRVRSCFGVELPLRAVFDHPTLEGLAAVVDAALRGGETVSTPPIRPVPRDRPLPLSPAQNRLWLAQRLAPESADYNVPQAVRLRGSLAASALAATVAEVKRRHEALRTAFPQVDGEPVQAFEPPAPPAPLPVVDLSLLPPSARQAALDALLADLAERPFDLGAGSPLRVRLFRLAAADHTLLFVAHHIVCDAWSMGVLLAEVGGLYEAAAEGRAFPGAAPALQLADIAAWQGGWLEESGELDRQLAYWRERLAGCPPVLDLPLDRPRSASRRPHGGKVRVRVGAAERQALERLARREGATLFLVLLAIFQSLLQRYSGQEDFAVGVPVAGRSRREMEDVIGFFVNTLVLRADLSGDPSLRRLIARVRENALAAFAHQDVPFDLLVERLAPPRRPGCSPFFQSSFMLLDARRGGLRLPGLDVSNVELEGRRLRTDLQLQLLDVHEGMVGAVHYDASLFERETVEEMVRRFTVLVAAVTADPDAPLSSHSLIARDESGPMYAGFAGALEEA